MKKINIQAPPNSWNALSAAQLEMLIDLYERKLNPNLFLFFAYLRLSGLKVLRKEQRMDKGDTVFFVRRNGWKAWLRREVLPIKSYQIQYWIDKYLGYLDKMCNLRVFPYPKLRLRGTKFQGPSICMANFSWQQYKFAQDFLQNYRDEARKLTMLIEKNGREEEIKKSTKSLSYYRNLFLATLFTPQSTYINKDTGCKEKGYHFFAENTYKYASRFNSISDVQFKVILLFWDGTSAYLQDTFPRLYKESGKPDKKINRLKMESMNMVTLIDRLKCSDKELYNMNAYFVLETLERITIEAEEIEAMNKKNQ